MPSPCCSRILIVDDHPMMREGLRTLISRERDLTVCGEAETAGQALDAVANLKPDLVLVDMTLPGRNGIELIKDICALQHALLILIISIHDESLYAQQVLHAGARGYIMKQGKWPGDYPGNSSGVSWTHLPERQNVGSNPRERRR
jgi:DNA-binding NarL/FixJ family response regulator